MTLFVFSATQYPLTFIHSFLFFRSDLLIACKEIGEGKLHVPELLGDIHIDPITTEGAYDTKLDSKRVQNTRILELLQRYTKRRGTIGQQQN